MDKQKIGILRVVEEAFYQGNLSKLRMYGKKRDDLIALLDKEEGKEFFSLLCRDSLTNPNMGFWVGLVCFLQPKPHLPLDGIQQSMLANCVVKGCLETGNIKVLHLFARNFVKEFDRKMSACLIGEITFLVSNKHKKSNAWTGEEADCLGRVISDPTLRSLSQYASCCSILVNHDVELFWKVLERAKLYDRDAFVHSLPHATSVAGLARQGKLWDFYCWVSEQKQHQGKTNPMNSVFMNSLSTLLTMARSRVDEKTQENVEDFLSRVDCRFLVQLLRDAHTAKGRGVVLSADDFLFYMLKRSLTDIKTMADHLRGIKNKSLNEIVQKCDRHIMMEEVSPSFETSSSPKKKLM